MEIRGWLAEAVAEPWNLSTSTLALWLRRPYGPLPVAALASMARNRAASSPGPRPSSLICPRSSPIGASSRGWTLTSGSSVMVTTRPFSIRLLAGGQTPSPEACVSLAKTFTPKGSPARLARSSSVRFSSRSRNTYPGSGACGCARCPWGVATPFR